jgi:hypothetical protein
MRVRLLPAIGVVFIAAPSLIVMPLAIQRTLAESPQKLTLLWTPPTSVRFPSAATLNTATPIKHGLSSS